MAEMNLKFDIDHSYKIINKILLFKNYKSREEVLTVAGTMVKMARNNSDYSDELKNAYLGAFEKLNMLTFDEMKEIISILNI